MAIMINDRERVHAFLDALQEIRDTAEFERLMLGQPRRIDWEQFEDGTNASQIRYALPFDDDDEEDCSALAALKADLALERLRSRHPDVWERVALGEGGE